MILVTREVYKKAALGQRAKCYACEKLFDDNTDVIAIQNIIPQKFRLHPDCADAFAKVLREAL